MATCTKPYRAQYTSIFPATVLFFPATVLCFPAAVLFFPAAVFCFQTAVFCFQTAVLFFPTVVFCFQTAVLFFPTAVFNFQTAVLFFPTAVFCFQTAVLFFPTTVFNFPTAVLYLQVITGKRHKGVLSVRIIGRNGMGNDFFSREAMLDVCETEDVSGKTGAMPSGRARSSGLQEREVAGGIVAGMGAAAVRFSGVRASAGLVTRINSNGRARHPAG
jgi:hypothetical protein